MILVEFGLHYPILREALERAPEMQVAWKRSDQSEGGPHRTPLRTEGGDFAAFADASKTTPHLHLFAHRRGRFAAALQDRTEGRRATKGRVSVPRRASEHPPARHRDHEGREFRVAFPDRTAFGQFYDFCRSNDLGCDVHRFYEERGNADTPRFGLTDAQRETLVTAVDRGYLEIPRESSLADLSDHFGIPEAAVSERFRRGVKRLVETTVYSDAG